MQVSPPRGMRDFLPGDKGKRERVLGLIRSAYAAHGFDEIETPVVEDFGRLHAGLGGDNEKLAFNVMKRGLDAAALQAAADADDPDALADLGLRFDLTVPLARFYATHRAALPQVFRAVQIAPVWRAERPQKGRYRQFVQCDIDIIGEPGILAEIELLTATLATLDALGLERCRIRINDRRVLFGLLESFGFDDAEHDSVLVTIDKLDKVGPSGVIDELTAKGATEGAVAALSEWLHAPERALPSGRAEEARSDIARIEDALRASGVEGELVFDPFLVRGMGYYTGTIFEIEHPDFSFSLGGGGRYDGMIGRFLGEDVPACGFSIGFERIIDLIADPAADAATSLVLVHDKADDPERLLRFKRDLIARGHRVRLERRTKNLAPLLQRAQDAGFRAFALLNRGAQGVDDLEIRPFEQGDGQSARE